MSPQSLQYPSPATGDVAEAHGRHRRPESLADARPRVSYDLPAVPVPAQRSARHHRNIPAQRGVLSQLSALGQLGGLAQSNSRSARHSAGHRAAGNQRPVTGSHRAPGTLPIESWLLMGKTRQQVLLASLVAAGLLLVAIPSTRGSENIDAVNAAAQGKSGTHAAQKAKTNGGSGNSSKDDADATPAGATTTPAPSAPAVQAGGAIPASEIEHGKGPGKSMLVTGNTTVALTFDDGPDPEQTPKILALLDQYQIKATFCLVGQQVQKHPEIVRQIVAAGHTLCNHTWNHSLTIGKDKPEKIQADLARTNAAIEAAAPGTPVPFFRAPGGNFTDALVGVAASDGMTSLYWQVDPQDWNHTEGETDAAHIARVVATVKKHVRPGSIVLSHDFNQPDTIAAYQKLLPWLKENFTLGIPAQPTTSPTTPPTASPTPSSPTPTETPATPDPAVSASPQPADAAATS
ncbi:polysaccharide deacetylase family protein [Actinoplanes sp. NPDC026619]|uniref:polysaccharide deacetylase family protein n=1 Tax=Actinoplanes sp. NPDC026619 TaxID=3155798 RepID=UPI003400A641